MRPDEERAEEYIKKAEEPPAPGRMNRAERRAALLLLPVHLFAPGLLMSLPALRKFTETQFNLICYSFLFLCLLLTCFPFLRREYRGLRAEPGSVIRQVLLTYGIMLLLNLAMSFLLARLPGENPNNAAVGAMAKKDILPTALLALVLAPVSEEILFRGGLYGAMERKLPKTLAAVLCILSFSLYHVWAYALSDTGALLWLPAYLPASWALWRVYDRCETIWASILFHILNNLVSLTLMQFLT